MRVDELFNIEICKNPISREYVEDNKGSTAYVTTTSENNGVDGYTNYPAQYQGNVITVSKDGASADAFYQSEPFCGNEKVMVLIPKYDLTPIQMMFYAYAISYNKERFAYGRKCSVERLSELNIPAIDEIPDWVSKTEIKPLTTKNKVGQAPELRVNEWKPFRLGNLFDIRKGKRLTSDEREDGNNNYVGAIDSNNGIANHISQEPIHSGNTISLSYNGSVGEAFYQKDAYWATDDVNALYSKYEYFNEYIGLFLASVIRQEKYKFSYGRKWTLINMQNTNISLPIRHNEDGTAYIDETRKYSEDGYVPDWDFMENYIKSLPYGDRLSG